MIEQLFLFARFKYPLVTVARLLQVFEANLGGGYDTGCHFLATLGKSELGALAHALNYTLLVDGFHGHAHQ